MIVIDGDSVAYCEHDGKPIEHSWPQMMARQSGMQIRSFARHESTSRDCLLRIRRALLTSPIWYVLCVGQWAQNHELADEFEENVREIIEECLARGTRVCLVAPPVQVADGYGVWRILDELDVYYRVQLVDLLAEIEESGETDWFDGVGSIPCHFTHQGNVRVALMFKDIIK